MAVRVLEVDAAAAIVMVDLAFLAPLWIGPIRETLLLDPAENHVELRLAHEEREMTRRDVALPVHEVEIDAVGGRDDLERPSFASRRQTEDAGEKIRRHLTVVGQTMVWLSSTDMSQFLFDVISPIPRAGDNFGPGPTL
jgi:hypothetical protein